MSFSPRVNADVLSEAVPPVKGAEPNVTLPSANVTEPGGVVPVPGCGVTVAVKVTEFP
jgi:hypothetical protein